MIDESTITQYNNKKYKGKKIGKVKTSLSQVNELYMESMISKELNHSIKSLCKIFPDLSHYISPTLTDAHNLQDGIGYINIK